MAVIYWDLHSLHLCHRGHFIINPEFSTGLASDRGWLANFLCLAVEWSLLYWMLSGGYYIKCEYIVVLIHSHRFIQMPLPQTSWSLIVQFLCYFTNWPSHLPLPLFFLHKVCDQAWSLQLCSLGEFLYTAVFQDHCMQLHSIIIIIIITCTHIMSWSLENQAQVLFLHQCL